MDITKLSLLNPDEIAIACQFIADEDLLTELTKNDVLVAALKQKIRALRAIMEPAAAIHLACTWMVTLLLERPEIMCQKGTETLPEFTKMMLVQLKLRVINAM